MSAAFQTAAGPAPTAFFQLSQESDLTGIAVQGRLPDWLAGRYIRNGPSLFEFSRQKLAHLFDGMAMLHAFHFHTGQVDYRSRFLHSENFLHGQRTGRLSNIEFGSNPPGAFLWRQLHLLLLRQPFLPNANVSLIEHAGRAAALTEVPDWVAFDTRSLRTEGLYAAPDAWQGQTASPHPQTDADTLELYNVSTRMGRHNSYELYRLAPGSTRRQRWLSIPAPEPAYMHSFAMTPRFLILIEQPWFFNVRSLLLKNRTLRQHFEWKPERGTRFIVVDKQDARVVGRYHCPAFFFFHTVQAFEQQDALLIDLLAMPDPSAIDHFFVGHIDPSPAPFARLRRYRLDRHDIKADSDANSEADGEARLEWTDPWPHMTFELPAVHPAPALARRRYVYMTGSLHRMVDCLVKADLDTGTLASWSEPGCWAGEPAFIAEPGAVAEDQGLILSLVVDTTQQRSFLLMLDARSWQERGRALLPHAVPFGTHGRFFRDRHA